MCDTLQWVGVFRCRTYTIQHTSRDIGHIFHFPLGKEIEKGIPTPMAQSDAVAEAVVGHVLWGMVRKVMDGMGGAKTNPGARRSARRHALIYSLFNT